MYVLKHSTFGQWTRYQVLFRADSLSVNSHSRPRQSQASLLFILDMCMRLVLCSVAIGDLAGNSFGESLVYRPGRLPCNDRQFRITELFQPFSRLKGRIHTDNYFIRNIMLRLGLPLLTELQLQTLHGGGEIDSAIFKSQPLLILSFSHMTFPVAFWSLLGGLAGHLGQTSVFSVILITLCNHTASPGPFT